MEYTIEVFKQDRRSKLGERLVTKLDGDVESRADLETWLASIKQRNGSGHRYVMHKTYVLRKNLKSGREFIERYDTPCRPYDRETYRD